MEYLYVMAVLRFTERDHKLSPLHTLQVPTVSYSRHMLLAVRSGENTDPSRLTTYMLQSLWPRHLSCKKGQGDQ